MKKVTAAATGALVLAGLALVGVLTLGGFSLLSTRGTSMQPAFQPGDLAVLRPASGLAVGNVAAYRSPMLRRVVMHRVTAINGGRYSFRGDNNSWTDSEALAAEDLVGELAFRLPRAGGWLDRATSKAGLTLLALFFVLGGGTTSVIARRQRKRRRRASTSKSNVRRELLSLPVSLRAAAVIALVALSGAGALTAITWNTAPKPEDRAHTAGASAMTYSYLAIVAPSAAYDGTSVLQPQPIFRKVADTVHVTLDYDAADDAHSGPVDVTAELSTAEGWRSTIPLRASGAYFGNRFIGQVVLELDELQRRADSGTRAAGSGVGGGVSVTVVAEVRSPGQPAFRSELPFILDAVALRLAEGDATPLTIKQDSTAAGRAEVSSAPLAMLSSIPPRLSRITSVSGLILALLALFAVGVWAKRLIHAPEHRRIQQTYPDLLLTIEPVILPAGRAVIDVPALGGLARLAQRYGLLVMHWHRGGVHTYVVFEEHTTYRYRYVELTTQIEGQPEAHAKAATAALLDHSDVPASDAAGSY